MRLRVIIAALAAMVACSARASEPDSLSDIILEHEVRLAGSRAGIESNAPILIVIDLREGRQRGLVRRKFIGVTAHQKFSDSHVSSKIHSGDLAAELSSGKVPLEVLLAKKMVLGVEVMADESEAGYRVVCSLAFIEYRDSRTDSRTLLPSRVWSDRRDIKGISKEAIEDNLADYIQIAIGNFVKHYRAEVSGKCARSSKDGAAIAPSLSYTLKRNDPDHRRNHFFIGGSVGTPALGNVNLGFWGGRSFPWVFGISGMYYGLERRGIQVDAGWAFDNTGTFRHVVGLAFVGTNETVTNMVYDRNVFGDVTRVQTGTYNHLAPYVGPAYTLDWKNFRLQAGVGFRLSDDTQSSARALFQIGYTPPLDL